MKKLFLYPALVIALTLSFAACSNDDSIDEPPPGENTDPKSTNEYFLSNLEDMKQEFKFDNDADEAKTITGKTVLNLPSSPEHSP